VQGDDQVYGIVKATEHPEEDLIAAQSDLRVVTRLIREAAQNWAKRNTSADGKKRFWEDTLAFMDISLVIPKSPGEVLDELLNLNLLKVREMRDRDSILDEVLRSRENIEILETVSGSLATRNSKYNRHYLEKTYQSRSA